MTAIIAYILSGATAGLCVLFAAFSLWLAEYLDTNPDRWTIPIVQGWVAVWGIVTACLIGATVLT